MRWFWGLLVAAAVVAVAMMVMPRGKPSAPPPTLAPVEVPTPANPVEPTPAAKPKATASQPASAPAASKSPAESTPHTASETSVRPVQPAPSAAGTSPRPVDPAAGVVSTAPDASVSPTPAPGAVPAVATAPAPLPEAAPASSPAPSAATPSDKGASGASASPSRGWAATGFVGPPRPEEAEAMAMQSGLDAALGLTEPGVGDAGAAASHESPSASPASTSKPAAGADATAKAKLTPRDDGTTLVDDRFVIKGAGTHEDPYVISWEMLVSAQESYQPRLGRKNIPDRLKMLDGKWVKIAGYIAFPIMAQSQDEMLMMLNQWDGCCIGVPPTPYDAIEVKLKAAAKGDDRMRVSGSITGILRVDPYLVKDWLVSLYLMDDAELKVETAGGKRPEAPPQGHVPPQ